MVATSTESVLHSDGYRIEAEDSASLLVSKAAASLHNWLQNGATILSTDWALTDWYVRARAIARFYLCIFSTV